MSRKKSRYEIVSVDSIPVVVSIHDYATRLARVAEALYPYFTSSASLDASHSSSLHLPETENVGSPASEEVSVYAGNETNDPAA